MDLVVEKLRKAYLTKIHKLTIITPIISAINEYFYGAT